MAHDHSHGGCGDECHDHDIPESEGPRDNIYLHVDKDNIVALNAANGHGKEVVKAWHERMDEEVASILCIETVCFVILSRVVFSFWNQMRTIRCK